MGHSGELVLGEIYGVKVACMKGRFHSYEGYPAWKLGFPSYVMKHLGASSVIITNAAGGLNPDFNIGDFMVMAGIQVT